MSRSTPSIPSIAYYSDGRLVRDVQGVRRVPVGPRELLSSNNDLRNMILQGSRSYNPRGRDQDTARRQRVDEISTRTRSWNEYEERAASRPNPSLLALQPPHPSFPNDLPYSNRQASTQLTSGSTAIIPVETDQSLQVSAVPGSIENIPPTRTEDDSLSYECTCCTGYQCRLRHADDSDCRPLVPDRVRRREAQDQETYMKLRELSFGNERIAKVAELYELSSILSTLESPTSSQRIEEQRENLTRWIIKMEDATISPGQAQQAVTQEILPCLKAFLAPSALPLRRAKGVHQNFWEEELTTLFRKWERGDFDGNVKRGLLAKDVIDQNGIRTRSAHDRVDPDWPHLVRNNFFGNGHLVNGQMWTSRIEIFRDGGHRVTQAGISGNPTDGAYSIVLGAAGWKKSRNQQEKYEGYADRDMGSTIEYMGTALPPPPNTSTLTEATNLLDSERYTPDSFSIDADGNPLEPTRGTQALIRSLNTEKPVRVFRSWNVEAVRDHRPAKQGYRYDGLYKVVSRTALHRARQIWSFRLERLSGQGPLRKWDSGLEVEPDSSGRQRGYFTLDKNDRRID